MSGGRRLVVDGRIMTSANELPRQRPVFLFRRFLVLTAILAGVLLSNPANEEHICKALNFFGSGVQHSLHQRRTTTSWTQSRKVTNYGLFAVKNDISRIQFLGLGGSVSCYLTGDKDHGDVLCEALRDTFCHRKRKLAPWESDTTDRAFTAQRILMVFILTGALVAACVEDPSTLYLHGGRQGPCGNLFSGLFNSFLAMFLPNPRYPVLSALFALLDSFLFYSTLAQMDIMVAMQSSSSLFGLIDSNNINFALSVLALLLAAAGVNALAAQWFGNRGKHHLLGFEMLVASALGYARGAVPLSQAVVSFVVPEWTSDIVTVTWIRALVPFLTGGHSLTSATTWFLGNMAGFLLGNYQYQHQFVQSFGRDIWNGVEGFIYGHRGYRW